MAIIQRPFRDYKREGHHWITLATGEYYPDVLEHACALYGPVLVMFGQLLKTSESSSRLFMQIAEIPDGWMRIQLTRVFKRYVSPELPVEMLKKKTQTGHVCNQFGARFRPIHQVHAAFMSRPVPDEALCALLWEYHQRGQKGYDLTEHFFDLFHAHFPGLQIRGPERAGKDILMESVFAEYPNPKRPVDFVIYDDQEILAIGLARYDSDHGGAQEDDRTGGYQNCANEILAFAQRHGFKAKIIFVNDGPGLLLGSMWDDYATIEESWPDKILVLTLRMLPERITVDWLKKE